MSDKQRVREANEQFYMAMNSLDIDGMDEVWADDPHAVCVHPGREALIGYERIRESWMLIFAATSSMSIAPSNERIALVNSDFAWVTCTEIISLMMEEGLAAAAAQATNVFRRTDGRWRMVVHHASPIPFTAEDEWPDLIN